MSLVLRPGSLRVSLLASPRRRRSALRRRSGRSESRSVSSGPTTCSPAGRRSAASLPNRAGNAGETVEERRLDYVILGVGMNANLDPAELRVPDREVTTIRSELGRDVDVLELLRVVLSNLDAELGRIEDFGAVLEDWRNLNCTLGEKVRVRRFGETVEGKAVDLSPEGTLLLSTRRVLWSYSRARSNTSGKESRSYSLRPVAFQRGRAVLSHGLQPVGISSSSSSSSRTATEVALKTRILPLSGKSTISTSPVTAIWSPTSSSGSCTADMSISVSRT